MMSALVVDIISCFSSLYMAHACHMRFYRSRKAVFICTGVTDDSRNLSVSRQRVLFVISLRATAVLLNTNVFSCSLYALLNSSRHYFVCVVSCTYTRGVYAWLLIDWAVCYRPGQYFLPYRHFRTASNKTEASGATFSKLLRKILGRFLILRNEDMNEGYL